MSIVDLNLPENAHIVGELRDDYGLFELDEDVLQVQFPSGEVIDVGWFLENEHEGKFKIVGLKKGGSWDRPTITQETTDVHQLPRIIEKIANYLLSENRFSIYGGASDNTTISSVVSANSLNSRYGLIPSILSFPQNKTALSA